MLAVPRSRQTPISFRSDRAAAALARLTRGGKSQARVIEEVLEDAVARERTPERSMTKEEFIAAVDAIVRPLQGLSGPTREEIEAEMYDEFGAPR